MIATKNKLKKKNHDELNLQNQTFAHSWCTALHCTALHCTALHCTALHCTALNWTKLPNFCTFKVHQYGDIAVLLLFSDKVVELLCWVSKWGGGGAEGEKTGKKEREKMPPPKKKIWTLPKFFWWHFFLKDKSHNLFKFVSVLLSASVERVGVSRMRDFFNIGEIWVYFSI